MVTFKLAMDCVSASIDLVASCGILRKLHAMEVDEFILAARQDGLETLRTLELAGGVHSSADTIPTPSIPRYLSLQGGRCS